MNGAEPKANASAVRSPRPSHCRSCINAVAASAPVGCRSLCHDQDPKGETSVATPLPLDSIDPLGFRSSRGERVSVERVTVMKTASFCSWLAGAAALSIGVGSAASAATLNTSNCCGSGPFGSVSASVVSTTELQLTFTLLSGFEFISGGQDAEAAFITDKAVTIDNISSTFATGGSNTPPTWTGVGNGSALTVHMDGAGHYGGGVKFSGNGGSDPGGSTLTFDITSVSGLLGLSDLTASFAADISTGCGIVTGTAVTCTGSTGMVWNGGAPAPTPLPAAFLLLSPVLGAGYFGLRRRRRTLGPATA
jgi:hypothetical protein